jgi:hypothetical protein
MNDPAAGLGEETMERIFIVNGSYRFPKNVLKAVSTRVIQDAEEK